MRANNIKGNLADVLSFLADVELLVEKKEKQAFEKGFTLGLNQQLNIDNIE